MKALILYIMLLLAGSAEAMTRSWNIDGNLYELTLITVDGNHALMAQADGVRHRIHASQFIESDQAMIQEWAAENRERVQGINKALAEWENITKDWPEEYRSIRMTKSEYYENRAVIVLEFMRKHAPVIDAINMVEISNPSRPLAQQAPADHLQLIQDEQRRILKAQRGSRRTTRWAQPPRANN